MEWAGGREMVYVGTMSDDPNNPRPEHFVPGAPVHADGPIILRMLAAVYADHPGYDPAWRVASDTATLLHHAEGDGSVACGSGGYPGMLSTRSWENVTCQSCLRDRPTPDSDYTLNYHDPEGGLDQ